MYTPPHQKPRSKRQFDLIPILSEQEPADTAQRPSNADEQVRKQSDQPEGQQGELGKPETDDKSQKPIELYVEGLTAAVTVEKLRTHFARYGEVLAVDLPVDLSTSRPCGHGHITLRPTVNESQLFEAEHVVGGLTIKVKERCLSDGLENTSVSCPTLGVLSYQERQEEFLETLNHSDTTVFIGGLKPQMEANILKAYFSQFGRLNNIFRAVKPGTTIPRGFGFVYFVEGTDISCLLAEEKHDLGCGFITVRTFTPFHPEPSSKHYFNLMPILPEQELADNTPSADQKVHKRSDQPEGQQGDLTKPETDDKSHEHIELFLEGLSAAVTADNLRTHFSHYGEVLAVDVPVDLSTNRPNEHGYITLRPTVDANQLFQTEHVVGGLTIKVKERRLSDRLANFSVSCPPSTDLSYQERQKEFQELLLRSTSTVFIGGLKPHMEANSLKAYFSQFGRLNNIFRAVRTGTTIPLGFGFVNFAEKTDVASVLANKRHDLEGGSIDVKMYTPSHPNPRSRRYFDLMPILSEQELADSAQSADEQVQKQSDPSEGALRKHHTDDKSEKAIKLYVEGLSAAVTAENLRTHFSHYGEVLAVDTSVNLSTNGPYGYGHISLLPTVNKRQLFEAEHIVSGRLVKVRERPSSECSEHSSVSFNSSTVSECQEKQKTSKTILDQNATNVFIGGLKKNMEGDILKAYFSKFGSVINIYRAVSAYAHIHLGFGFVSFVKGTDVDGLLMTEQHDVGCGFVEVRKYVPTKRGFRICQYYDLQSLLPEHSMETAKHEPSNPAKSVQLPEQQQQQEQQNLQKQKQNEQQKQQQHQEEDSRNQQVFYKAQKLLELSVTGVKAAITAEDLKTHFARFGDLVEVDLFINPTIIKHNGSGYIRLRPTAETNHVLKTEHIVCGVPINVKERSASDDSGQNSVCQSLKSANVQWEEEEEKMKNPDIATGPTIFVGGIGRKLSSEAVRDYFSRFGCVTKVRRAVVPSNGKQLAYGYVTFAKNTDISVILASKRHNVEGWDVEVRPYYRSKDPQKNRFPWRPHFDCS